MDSTATLRIEKWNYVFGAAFIALAAVFGTRDQIIGMTAGVAISCLNFSVLRRLVGRVVHSPDGKKSAAAALFLPQMLGLMGAVAVAVFFLPASPIYIAIGFSVFMVSIAIETARFLMSPVIGQ